MEKKSEVEPKPSEEKEKIEKTLFQKTKMNIFQRESKRIFSKLK